MDKKKQALLKKHSKRMQELLDQLALTPKGLQEALGTKSPSTIYHVLQERHLMSKKLCLMIVKRFKSINLNYLLDGKGDLVLDHKLKINQTRMIMGFEKDDVNFEDKLIERLLEQEKKIETLNKKLDKILSLISQ